MFSRKQTNLLIRRVGKPCWQGMAPLSTSFSIPRCHPSTLFCGPSSLTVRPDKTKERRVTVASGKVASRSTWAGVTGSWLAPLVPESQGCGWLPRQEPWPRNAASSLVECGLHKGRGWAGGRGTKCTCTSVRRVPQSCAMDAVAHPTLQSKLLRGRVFSTPSPAGPWNLASGLGSCRQGPHVYQGSFTASGPRVLCS